MVIETRESTATGLRGETDILARVENLHVTFERRGEVIQALRGVSLDIFGGEIVAVVGESGSGKSVLGLTLLGLLPTRPAPRVEGVVEVQGIDMVSAPSKLQRQIRRTHLGAVFQDPMTSLNPTMRVGDQLTEITGNKAEARELLELVSIPDPSRRLRSFPHELSGGLRQRVMIAMAVAGERSLVVADEPTTALDVTIQAQILSLLRELRDETGCSIVLITHDLGVGAQIADRVAVLYSGRLAELGSTEAVLADPAHPYTRSLLGARLTMSTAREDRLTTITGEPPDPRDPPPGCPFAARCELRIEPCERELPELSAWHGRRVACLRPGEAQDQRTGTATYSTSNQPVGESTCQAPAVVLEQVYKSFVQRSARRREHAQALRGVDLEVGSGESVVIVGESGCGKSTLLRVVAGLITPDSGRVELGAGARPQMVFQDAGASLTPWLTVGELVGERLREEHHSRKERDRQVVGALELVGLPAHVRKAKPHQLSGGQKQRVALARAIVVPPGLLLCDEPTSSLDVSIAATALNLLRDIREELGMAMLFVTHDLAVARVVADRIVVMYLGRIVESGPADPVTRAPSHPYTRALLAAIPGAGRPLVRLQGDPASSVDLPLGCSFHPRCPFAVAACRTTDPVLVPISSADARFAACIRIDELP